MGCMRKREQEGHTRKATQSVRPRGTCPKNCVQVLGVGEMVPSLGLQMVSLVTNQHRLKVLGLGDMVPNLCSQNGEPSDQPTPFESLMEVLRCGGYGVQPVLLTGEPSDQPTPSQSFGLRGYGYQHMFPNGELSDQSTPYESFVCGGCGSRPMLSNGEPCDQPTTTENLVCGIDRHVILPNQHTQQLQEGYHATPPYQNLENYLEVLDQEATLDGESSVEEEPLSLWTW